MAYYSSGARGWTPIEYANGATMADNAHHTVGIENTGRVGLLKEVFLGGEATASTPQRMAIRRHVTNASGGGVTFGALNPKSAATDGLTSFVAPSTTDPVTVSVGDTELLNLSFNAFGGLVRWLAGPGETLAIVFGASSGQQISLSSISGTGLVSDHMIFEQL